MEDRLKREAEEKKAKEIEDARLKAEKEAEEARLKAEEEERIREAEERKR